jgi:hypothetical protein
MSLVGLVIRLIPAALSCGSLETQRTRNERTQSSQSAFARPAFTSAPSAFQIADSQGG